MNRSYWAYIHGNCNFIDLAQDMSKTATAKMHSPQPTAPESAGAAFSMDWSDRFALGIDLIDQQHQVLFRLIDQLAKAIQDDTSADELKQIFDKLNEYTLTHFAAEESLMARYGYTGDHEHQENHRALAHSLAQLVERAKTGEPLVSLQTMNFLRQWLYGHIDDVDRQFADFLKAKGITSVHD